MKATIRLITFCIFLVTICSFIKPTGSSMVNSRPLPFVIHFQKDSFQLDTKAKHEIDSFITNGYLSYAGKLSTLIYYGDTSYSYDKLDIYISSLCCINERKKNKYVGLQRGLEIIEYIEHNYKLSRLNIILNDQKCDTVDNDCNDIGVILGLYRHH